MGGFLVAYLALKDLEKKRFSLWLFYVHRYMRLTIPYMLCVAFSATLWDNIGSGLQWYRVKETYAENCRTSWWVNLIYLHNFIHPDTRCMLQSWYLSADMQFFLISPLVFYPMYKFKKMWKSFVYWGIFMVAASVVPFTIAYVNELPPSFVFM